jgi:enoyl-CoA hydratase/carnithine racemase
MSSSSVIRSRDSRIGRILLNRPKSLNALDLEMIRLISYTLDSWREDPAIHAVVIEGSGDRAFCAGGDIRNIRAAAIAGDTDSIETFFREEYALNHAIAVYPKPYVALIDGLCLGGGIGVSLHGTVRVATEAAAFAMPETAIGFFPDIGASFFLPRLPGHLGMYLALTGARLVGSDSVHAGLATHFVPRESLSTLSATLAAHGVAALAPSTALLPPFSLAPHLAAINRCFAANSVPAILSSLHTEGTPWAAETEQTLRRMSPSALVWSHSLIAAGAHRTLAQCLEAELDLTRSVTRHPDFAEGVRAMVVDKDRTPHWQPPTIEELFH